MPEHGVRPPMHWFSPVRRGIVPLDGLRVSRSLRRSCREFEIRVDTAFEEVVVACGDPARDAGWITGDIAAAYGELHRLGWAHSVEAWRDGALAGGLYGVGIGGLFAGESMFHRVTDASKVALVGLVELLTADGAAGRLLDVQWVTPHLASLGAVEVPRSTYLSLLAGALAVPEPPAWQGVRRRNHDRES
jgi:leucyl/phenylalanyl-tRNA--protein transferase